MGAIKNELLECAATLERVGLDLPVSGDPGALLAEAEAACARLRALCSEGCTAMGAFPLNLGPEILDGEAGTYASDKLIGENHHERNNASQR